VPGFAAVAAGGLSLAGAVALVATAPLLVGFGAPAQAQEQKFLLKPGSKVGKESKVKATDCSTAADGTIKCDTKIVNPPGITPAKPSFNPFSN
jgi:hypothetical protein